MFSTERIQLKFRAKPIFKRFARAESRSLGSAVRNARPEWANGMSCGSLRGMCDGSAEAEIKQAFVIWHRQQDAIRFDSRRRSSSSVPPSHGARETEVERTADERGAFGMIAPVRAYGVRNVNGETRTVRSMSFISNFELVPAGVILPISAEPLSTSKIRRSSDQPGRSRSALK